MEESHEHTRKKVKYSDEVETMDRLSNLPESVILRILSLMNAKDAVQTCILSKQWKFYWAHIPCYTFDCERFTPRGFEYFITSVFRNRRPFNLRRPGFVIRTWTMQFLVKIFYRYAMLYRSKELEVRKKVQISDNQVVIDRLTSLPNPIIYHILSLIDTKYAVQTCVLSKKWRDHWTNIHALNFDDSSFRRCVDFHNFVLNVLQRHKSLDLGKLRLICGAPIKVTLVGAVFKYAMSHKLEGLETDVIGTRSISRWETSMSKCETLKTLTVYHRRLTDFPKFATLTTLEISAALPAETDLFSDCLNLENLILVRCELFYGDTFIISAPRLVTLTISDFTFCENIVITAATLKFINLKEDIPYLLSIDKCLALEKVNLHMSPPVYCQTQKSYASKMRDLVEGCCHAKSIEVSLNLSKGKFILYYSTADVQIKVVELNKETGKERLLFSSDINQLGIILEEMFAEKEAEISNQMDIDRLSNLPNHIIHHILSFVDTKCAVQTSVLSKKWRYHWTDIHNLNLECRQNKITTFKKFVLDVLQRRKPLNLHALRFHLRGAKSQALVRKISSYALSKSVEEFDTNLTTFPPSFFQCQTLMTLKLGPSTSHDLPNLSGLTFLTTLELTEVWLPNDCDYFTSCLMLENLSLIKCWVPSTLNISAPRLGRLKISNLIFLTKNGYEKVVISTPTLKFLNLSEMDPSAVLDMDDCPTLEKMEIYFQHQITPQICDHPLEFMDSISKIMIILKHKMSNNGCSLSLSLEEDEEDEIDYI
ncbi:hypothetical protein ACOSQ4_004211 [Xanthoceras sorbifolium]